MNVNLNNAQCIVVQSHFGYDTYVNICTGTHHDLAWVAGDWATFGVLSLVVLLLIGAVIGLMYSFR